MKQVVKGGPNKQCQQKGDCCNCLLVLQATVGHGTYTYIYYMHTFCHGPQTPIIHHILTTPPEGI